MIDPEMIPGVSRADAVRLIATARTFAPCLDILDGDAAETAIAILSGVAAELPSPGTRRVRSQSRNGTAVSMADFDSAFGRDDRAALRALCGSSNLAAAGAPVGHFPPGGVIEETRPEKERP